jgi:hypothetical protein
MINQSINQIFKSKGRQLEHGYENMHSAILNLVYQAHFVMRWYKILSKACKSFCFTDMICLKLCKYCLLTMSFEAKHNVIILCLYQLLTLFSPYSMTDQVNGTLYFALKHNNSNNKERDELTTELMLHTLFGRVHSVLT